VSALDSTKADLRKLEDRRCAARAAAIATALVSGEPSRYAVASSGIATDARRSFTYAAIVFYGQRHRDGKFRDLAVDAARAAVKAARWGGPYADEALTAATELFDVALPVPVVVEEARPTHVSRRKARLAAKAVRLARKAASAAASVSA